jgi:hypothetical protein
MRAASAGGTPIVFIDIVGFKAYFRERSRTMDGIGKAGRSPVGLFSRNHSIHSAPMAIFFLTRLLCPKIVKSASPQVTLLTIY